MCNASEVSSIVEEAGKRTISFRDDIFMGWSKTLTNEEGDEETLNILSCALKSNMAHIVESLLQGDGHKEIENAENIPFQATRRGNTPIMIAIRYSRKDIMETIISRVKKQDTNVLFYLVKKYEFDRLNDKAPSLDKLELMIKKR